MCLTANVGLWAVCTDPLNRSDTRDTSQSFTSAHSCSARARCRIWLRLSWELLWTRRTENTHLHINTQTKSVAEVRKVEFYFSIFYCEQNKTWWRFNRNPPNNKHNNITNLIWDELLKCVASELPPALGVKPNSLLEFSEILRQVRTLQARWNLSQTTSH